MIETKTQPEPLPPADGSVILVRAMHRAAVARRVKSGNRYDPEDHLIALADEVLRLRRLLADSPNDQAERRESKIL